MIDHLAHFKCVHWDPSIRTLAAHSLAGMIDLDVDYFISEIFPSFV